MWPTWCSTPTTMDWAQEKKFGVAWCVSCMGVLFLRAWGGVTQLEGTSQVWGTRASVCKSGCCSRPHNKSWHLHDTLRSSDCRSTFCKYCLRTKNYDMPATDSKTYRKCTTPQKRQPHVGKGGARRRRVLVKSATARKRLGIAGNLLCPRCAGLGSPCECDPKCLRSSCRSEVSTA